MAKAKTDTELLTEISRKLDSVLSFLAAKAVKDDQGGVVKRLHENGHSAEVIARVVGISENAVNIRLSRLRQKSSKTGGKPRNKGKVAIDDDQSASEEGPAS